MRRNDIAQRLDTAVVISEGPTRHRLARNDKKQARKSSCMVAVGIRSQKVVVSKMNKLFLSLEASEAQHTTDSIVATVIVR